MISRLPFHDLIQAHHISTALKMAVDAYKLKSESGGGMAGGGGGGALANQTMYGQRGGSPSLARASCSRCWSPQSLRWQTPVAPAPRRLADRWHQLVPHCVIETAQAQ